MIRFALLFLVVSILAVGIAVTVARYRLPPKSEPTANAKPSA